MAKTKKSDFQKLAERRAREAEALFTAGEFDGAYHLAGCAIECALKACIIKKLNTSDEWPDRNFSSECYNHNLSLLMKLAGLEEDLKQNIEADTQWAVVKDWSVESRYQHGKSQPDVRAFLDAINDPNKGVLQWIKGLW